MKKLSVLMVLILTVLLSSCGALKSNFNKAIINLNEAENFRMDMTLFNVPNIGEMSSYELVSGDQVYTNLLGYDSYKVTVDDKLYFLTEATSGYIATEDLYTTDTDEEGFGYQFVFDLDGKDFELNDDGYYSTEKVIDGKYEILVKLDGTSITYVGAKLDVNGVVIEMLYEFSDINETDLTFPQYTLYSTQETLLFEMFGAGFVYSKEGNVTDFVKDGANFISVVKGEDHFTVTKNSQTFNYYPETKEVEIDSVKSPLVTVDELIFTDKVYILLDYYYEEINK